MPPCLITYSDLCQAKKLWPVLSDAQKDEAKVKAADLRNQCLRMAEEQFFPQLAFVGQEDRYIESEGAWARFTATAKIEEVIEAMLELDDPLSTRIKPAQLALAEWPDPTFGMF